MFRIISLHDDSEPNCALPNPGSFSEHHSSQTFFDSSMFHLFARGGLKRRLVATSFARIDKLSPDSLRYKRRLVWLLSTDNIVPGPTTATQRGGTTGNKDLKLSLVQRRAPFPP
ncbi:hypothetical protein PMIN06_001686 [Paraphaeosphaeria minitans]